MSFLIFALELWLFTTLFHQSGSWSADGFVRWYGVVNRQLVAYCKGFPRFPQPQESLFLMLNQLRYVGNGPWPVTNIISGLCHGVGVGQTASQASIQLLQLTPRALLLNKHRKSD
ncbi:hypothetical protein AVEN_178580-1 [Araneus ventricosus]|uniref:Secreted protein n=1 Tax=Araneus ventricosus TaxID=182803 RepID=A0A4Y2GF27_ARAVE|nr:hypothetical protein AVEN_39599-1 [Araneus ventricosus]GBM51991.1 hypothetical protein AVEN_178580-1 [Araneus ventricosus]